MYEEYSNHDIAVYGGYLYSNEKILQSASGGIATALSENMLAKGGLVVGVSYSKDFYSAEYVVVDNKNDLDKLKGSKYIETDKNNIYSKVKDLILDNKKVLFIGLPCVIGALYSFLGNRPENLITCELICHGPTLKKVHTDYVQYLEKKHKSKIVDFSVRHKVGAWTPPYLYAKFENGKTFLKQFSKTEYGFAFYVVSKNSCYDCKFKGNNRQADITIGDFWGVAESDEFYNSYGTSSILVETENGANFLNSTTGIKLFPTTFDGVVEDNQMLISSKLPDKKRDKFYDDLVKKGLFYAVKHYDSIFVKVFNAIVPKKLAQRIKKIIKRS